MWVDYKLHVSECIQVNIKKCIEKDYILIYTIHVCCYNEFSCQAYIRIFLHKHKNAAKNTGSQHPVSFNMLLIYLCKYEFLLHSVDCSMCAVMIVILQNNNDNTRNKFHEVSFLSPLKLIFYYA